MEIEPGIYHADGIDLINQLPDESIDLCLTDPPYGVAYQSAWRTDKLLWKPKIENDERPFTEWIEPLYSKMKEGGRLICFYRWDVQQEFLEAIQSAGFHVKSQIVWDKMVHGMGDLEGEFAPQHELIFYATKGRYCFANKRPKSIYRVQRVGGEKLIHPNEKPIGLIAALIRDLTSPGELILDPFGGSFSTFLAANKEGRDCISCEISKHYFDIGQEKVLKVMNRYLSGMSLPIRDPNDYSKNMTGLFAATP